MQFSRFSGYILAGYCFVLGLSLQADPYVPHYNASGNLQWVENRGQWPENFAMKAELNGGALFLEDDGFTFSFLHPDDWAAIANHHELAGQQQLPEVIRASGVKIRFNQAGTQLIEGLERATGYRNYFLGNDPSRWKGRVPVWKIARYEALYPGTDLYFYQAGGHLKYDLVMAAGSNPAIISMEIVGARSVQLENGTVRIQTGVNDLVMQAPLAYQLADGKKQTVPCHYQLTGNKVQFIFPEGYDPSLPLVIDPVLIFSTYTGSTADNWGFTATYDSKGNFYAGGIAFATGYPVTLGSFQTNFQGGSGFFRCDVSITKFTPAGDSLIFSTYLGGTRNEIPHSMIVNSHNELLVYGTTASQDFPVPVNGYDITHSGGSTVNLTAIEFLGGTDIFVVKFNPSGSNLLGGTFIGGSGNDGLNDAFNLNHNYADHARGEIITDNQDRVYIASCTDSPDFPTTPGALQAGNAGVQDACLFMLDSSLTSLLWSTYLGGSGDDAAYSMKLGAAQTVYVCGGTTSFDFPATSGSYQTTHQGGGVDGWIAKIANSGTVLQQATFLGTNQYDQTYFIELDDDQKVYVVGQTAGPWPVTTGVYSNPNSGQFITKLNNDLSAIAMSTVFGKGDGDPELSPTAFLVDNCKNIYVSGWGGAVNGSIGYITGFVTTPDAYQSTTDGSDFYFFVLSKDASSLVYATYFGGSVSAEHVDGGTSRFDKTGIIYQAVCAGCGGHDDFPYTPGAWSNDNKSTNCNLGAAKFEFQLNIVQALAQASPATAGCAPLQVQFSNNGTQNAAYYWDFGDGQTANQENPVHTFSQPGSYTVQFIVTDTANCHTSDTAYLPIQVYPNATADFSWSPTFINPGVQVQFTNTGSGSTGWYWDFGDGDTSTLENPSHTYADTGIYTVCLKAKGQGGCDDSICYALVVSDFALIDVPSAFSPNGDGINDVFYVRGEGVEKMIFKIYNRWGQLMFQTTDLSVGWDGTYKGVPQEMEVYVYTLDAVLVNGEEVSRKGNITLIR